MPGPPNAAKPDRGTDAGGPVEAGGGVAGGRPLAVDVPEFFIDLGLATLGVRLVVAVAVAALGDVEQLAGVAEVLVQRLRGIAHAVAAAGERVQGADQRRGQRGAADRQPAGFGEGFVFVAAVDVESGVGVRHRRDVAREPVRPTAAGRPSSRLLLPQGSGEDRAAAPARGGELFGVPEQAVRGLAAVVPDGLALAQAATGELQRGTAGGHDRGVGRGRVGQFGRGAQFFEFLPVVVAGVPRGGHDHDPGVVVGGEVFPFFPLRSPVGVGDLVGAERHRLVGRRRQVGVAFGVGLDQQDLAVLAHAAHRLHVEADLNRPAAGVRPRKLAGAAGLAHLREAAVPGRARRQPVVGVERGEVLFDLRVVEGIHDRHRLTGAGGGRREGVRAGQVRRGQTARGALRACTGPEHVGQRPGLALAGRRELQRQAAGAPGAGDVAQPAHLRVTRLGLFAGAVRGCRGGGARPQGKTEQTANKHQEPTSGRMSHELVPTLPRLPSRPL